ncbi:MAG TPA: DUF507 family protein [Campylobacterales bacterium]|nr:DUF507 family protein [Campylobacterales bacterium]
MKISLPHAPYIANKISIDLLSSGYATFTKGLDPVKVCAQKIIEEDLEKEKALEQRVEEILEENEDEMEFMQVDRRSMFWMIKKKIAKEHDFILSYEDRFSNVAHFILDKLWEESLMDYSVTENLMKNVIYTSIEDYIQKFEDIEQTVIDKIDGMKRKVIPGTDIYNTLFERLYREELQRKGMF